MNYDNQLNALMDECDDHYCSCGQTKSLNYEKCFTCFIESGGITSRMAQIINEEKIIAFKTDDLSKYTGEELILRTEIQRLEIMKEHLDKLKELRYKVYSDYRESKFLEFTKAIKHDVNAKWDHTEDKVLYENYIKAKENRITMVKPLSGLKSKLTRMLKKGIVK